MRAKGHGLREVERRFLVWRKRREGRRIPTELWDAAVALVAEHSSTEICRVLGLNPTRFKKAREARSRAAGQRMRAVRIALRESERRPSRGCPRPPSAFVEVPAVAASSSVMQVGPAPRLGAHGCRLSVETPTGVLSVLLPAVEHDLVTLIRRCVAAALGEGSAA